MAEFLKGGCQCGAVRFEAALKSAGVSACHCGMCRRIAAGPFMAAETDGPIRFVSEETLSVFQSSDWGERGFCGRCGTILFWRMNDGSHNSLNPYTLNDPPALGFEQEIFIDAKPDHYAFVGDHPRLTEAELMAQFNQNEAS